MTTLFNLEELEQRHRSLEQKIEEERTHPGSSDFHITALKRQKLQLKDEIVRMQIDNPKSSCH